MKTLCNGFKETIIIGNRLRCKNCSYIWTYKGKNNWYATCPRCLHKVNVKMSSVNKLEDI